MKAIYPLFISVVWMVLLISCETAEGLDAEEESTFIKLYGGAEDQEGIDVQQTNDGGFIILGSTSTSTGGVNKDFFSP